MQPYWYVLVNDSQIGPLNFEEVRDLHITPSTMVWREGMSQWLPAMQVPELSSLFTGGFNTTPPPPPGSNDNSCGQQQYYYNQPPYYNNYHSGKDKIVAGILAILLGSFGAQYFYLGRFGAGIICIILSLISYGIWPLLMLAQGIMMLIMTQQEFDTKYVYSTSSFPIF